MDPRISRLKTIAQCDAFAKNAADRNAPELARQARERAIQIRAESHGATTPVEIECLQAVHAYEEVLSSGRARRARANRTWQMIDQLGVIPAVERLVAKREASSGYNALAEMGLKDYAFEAVVLRNPESFSAEAIEASRLRLENE